MKLDNPLEKPLDGLAGGSTFSCSSGCEFERVPLFVPEVDGRSKSGSGGAMVVDEVEGYGERKRI